MDKKSVFNALVAAVATVFFVSAVPGDGVISKQGDTTVVNTTSLTKSISGFKGATPVKIYIAKNKIVKVEALKNMESRTYFAKAKAVLHNYVGKSVSKAEKMEVDAVSGATFSSEGLIKNVKAGLKYYRAHK